MNCDKEREKKITSSEQFDEMYEQYTHKIKGLKEIRKDLCFELSKLDGDELPQLFRVTQDSILSIEKALEYLTASVRILDELRVGPYGNPLNEKIVF